MAFTNRIARGALLPLLLAGCATSGEAPTPAAAPPPAAQPAAVSGFQAGTPPEFCPNVTLREGTAILDRPTFVASITAPNRDCRVRDGTLYMQVAIAGRVTPKGGSGTTTVRLPVRVAVTRGDKVLYSKLGTQAVTINAGAGAQTFAFVDQAVAVPGPSDRTLTVFAGFDEGPPAGSPSQ